MSKGPDDRAPMDAGRFAAIAAAYGGQLQRWPQAEQAAGARFAQSDAGRAILRQAGSLDAMLDSYGIKAPDGALRGNILQTAQLRLIQHRRRRFWWFGLGLAGVGLAGAIAGLAVVTIIMPEVQPDHYVLDANVTAFGDAGPDAEAIEEDL